MIDRLNDPDAGPGQGEVDRLLSEFYRAEMPDPWPRARVPLVYSARRSAPRFARSMMRFAVAATVVLALLAYWAIAGFFPGDGVAGGAIKGPEIGDLPKLSPVEHQQTPAGNPVQVFEESLSTGQAIIIIGAPNQKGPR